MQPKLAPERVPIHFSRSVSADQGIDTSSVRAPWSALIHLFVHLDHLTCHCWPNHWHVYQSADVRIHCMCSKAFECTALVNSKCDFSLFIQTFPQNSLLSNTDSILIPCDCQFQMLGTATEKARVASTVLFLGVPEDSSHSIVDFCLICDRCKVLRDKMVPVFVWLYKRW